MLLSEMVTTSQAVAATAARGAKIALLADCLRRLDPVEAAIGVAFLSGQVLQRQSGIGPAAFRDLPPPADATTLTLSDVDGAIGLIAQQAGPASQGARRRRLVELLARATGAEQRFLAHLLTGELRQGALEGVVLEAIARAVGAVASEVRRAYLLRGSLSAVAEVALRDGVAGLRSFRLEVGRPVQPMLAQPAVSLAVALARISPAAIEWKLDGARAQIHVQGSMVWVFTRSLDDVTARVPELVEAARTLPVQAAVLDGEAIALRADGRPHPFQVTAGRLGSQLEVGRLRTSLPLTPFLFDILHLDGQDLLELSGAERFAALAAVAPEVMIIPRIVTDDLVIAADFQQRTLSCGHEGVMVKSLSAPYEAGRRGVGWIKVKPHQTLDLIVLAAEWGHGRRQGWLSNLHLGARDPATGEFVMLGKTFKGLTDEMLAWQTQRLQELARDRDQWTVFVRPELVVEVAFEGLQRSPRYSGGVTLRFARVVRYRPDKRAEEADTIETVLARGDALPGPA